MKDGCFAVISMLAYNSRVAVYDLSPMNLHCLHHEDRQAMIIYHFSVDTLNHKPTMIIFYINCAIPAEIKNSRALFGRKPMINRMSRAKVSETGHMSNSVHMSLRLAIWGCFQRTRGHRGSISRRLTEGPLDSCN